MYPEQNLPSLKAGDAVRNLASAPLADGLGYPPKGSPLGKSLDGLAVVRRCYAGHPFELRDQGGRNRVRTKARLRVFCSGA